MEESPCSSFAPRFCQASTRHRDPVGQSYSAFPCRVSGPLTVPEGELKSREGLIWPGHEPVRTLTHTHPSPPIMTPSPAQAVSYPLPRRVARGGHGRSAGSASPLPRQPWPPPLAPGLSRRRLPSIFCPPHLSANREEKSLPSLCLSCRCDIWPPSEPPSPAVTLLLPQTPQG